MTRKCLLSAKKSKGLTKTGLNSETLPVRTFLDCAPWRNSGGAFVTSEPAKTESRGQFSGFERAPVSKQWAAVKTTFGAIMAPPQK